MSGGAKRRQKWVEPPCCVIFWTRILASIFGALSTHFCKSYLSPAHSYTNKAQTVDKIGAQ